jgi:putative ABC transport system permease protein
MAESLWQDLRHAVRALRRTPGFAAAAILTVAIGIGAMTAIFSVVHAVLLRPLPYAEPDRIVSVWTAWDDTPRGRLSAAEYFDLLDQADAFEHLGVWANGYETATTAGTPERLRTGYVSYGVLPSLGVEPQAGRGFTAADDVPDSGVVIITDGLWQRHYGAAPDVVGRRVVLDNRARTIVGIMPPGFRLPDDFDTPEPIELLVPLGLDRRSLPGRGSHFLLGAAKVRGGMSVEQADAHVRAVADGFTRAYPAEYPAAMRFTAGVSSLHEDVVGDARPVLMTLLAAIGFVLLIACGNISHLFLSRGERRRGEFALRLALGAGRMALVRQTLVESAVTALAGGGLGVLIAAAATRALVAISPQELPRLQSVGTDLPVLAFGLLAAAMVGLAVGVIPALQATHGAASLGEGRAIAGAAPARQRVRRVLIASEVALAIVLTLGAGLMVKSLVRLLSVDPGYRPEGVLTASVSVPESEYADGERTSAFFQTLLGRLREQPGILAAGAVSGLPLTQPLGDLNFQIEGRETPPGQRSRRADWQVVTPGYFEAIGMRVRQGRGIDPADTVDTPGVVVLNEAAARLHWPDGDAFGRRLRLGGGAGPGWVTVVGIVNDVKHASLRAEARPEIYLAHTQFRFWGGGAVPVRTLTLVVRGAGDPTRLAATLRRELAATDPALPLADVRTMTSVRSTSVASARFTSMLLSMFAVVALAVTLVGVYGVMAYAVAQRRREIGVRVALGAAPRSVIGLVLRQGFTPAAIGIAAGVFGGMALSGALRAQLFQVAPYDAATAAAVCAVVGAVALAACYVPAARAARVDPVTALRAE